MIWAYKVTLFIGITCKKKTAARITRTTAPNNYKPVKNNDIYFTTTFLTVPSEKRTTLMPVCGLLMRLPSMV